MRAAAFTSAAVVAIGAYLMIAAALNLAVTTITFGVLGIAITVAITIVSAEGRAAPSR